MKKIAVGLAVSLMIISLAGCNNSVPENSEKFEDITVSVQDSQKSAEADNESPEELLKELNGLADSSRITLDELSKKGYDFSLFNDHTESGVALAYKLYKLDTANIYAVVYSYMPEDQADNKDNKVLLFVADPESEEIYNKFSELFEASHPIE